ncbi:MAG: ATP-binding cassette domain-containing protein [Candidatus Eisenbacteria bacterium]|nr:ATP-binding cassette domain-containing protein [Candidatus Eisenbacteria bacterium]
MEHSTILEARDLRLDLGGKRILDGLSVEFWEGHVHAIVGPNGAGKSTLAATIMGLHGYREHDGDVLLDGRSIRGATVDERARKGITLAWQEPARYEGLSVRDFVLAGVSEDGGDLDELLELVGLEPDRYRERAVDRTLSGGERKRIELASILAMRPRVVLMDEPDSGIDVEALNRIFEAIGSLRERGATVLLITHSLTVLKQADHAFLMCCGRVIRKGAVSKIEQYFGEKCIPCDHQNRPDMEESRG